jgi:hypothetical protein
MKHVVSYVIAECDNLVFTQSVLVLDAIMLNVVAPFFLGYTEYVWACQTGRVNSFDDLSSLMTQKVRIRP